MNYDDEIKEVLIEKAVELKELFERPKINDVSYIKVQARKILNEVLSVLSVIVVR